MTRQLFFVVILSLVNLGCSGLSSLSYVHPDYVQGKGATLAGDPADSVQFDILDGNNNIKAAGIIVRGSIAVPAGRHVIGFRCVDGVYRQDILIGLTMAAGHDYLVHCERSLDQFFPHIRDAVTNQGIGYDRANFMIVK